MEAAAHRWSGPAELELDSPVIAPVPLPPGISAHEAPMLIAKLGKSQWQTLSCQVGGTTFHLPEEFQPLRALGKGELCFHGSE